MQPWPAQHFWRPHQPLLASFPLGDPSTPSASAGLPPWGLCLLPRLHKQGRLALLSPSPELHRSPGSAWPIARARHPHPRPGGADPSGHWSSHGPCATCPGELVRAGKGPLGCRGHRVRAGGQVDGCPSAAHKGRDQRQSLALHSVLCPDCTTGSLPTIPCVSHTPPLRAPLQGVRGQCRPGADSQCKVDACPEGQWLCCTRLSPAGG